MFQDIHAMKVAKSQKAFWCLNLQWKEANQLKKSFSTVVIKFIYSEKATKFCEITTLLLTLLRYTLCDFYYKSWFASFHWRFKNQNALWDFSTFIAWISWNQWIAPKDLPLLFFFAPKDLLCYFFTCHPRFHVKNIHWGIFCYHIQGLCTL